MMSTPSMEAMIERIERLERERRQTVWAGGAVLSIALALLASQAHLLRGKGTLEADRFVLRDADGKSRATLEMGHDGNPALTFLDPAGQSLVRLHGSTEQFSALTFMNQGRAQMALNSMPDGSSSFQMYDRRQRSSSGMYLWPDGTTGLGLRNGQQGIDLVTRPDGQSSMSTLDEDGLPREQLSTTPVADLKPKLTAAAPRRRPEMSIMQEKPEMP